MCADEEMEKLVAKDLDEAVEDLTIRARQVFCYLKIFGPNPHEKTK